MSNTNPSPDFGRLKAAGQRDTTTWLMEVVIPQLRRYARRHGKVETGQKFAHVEGSLRTILDDGLKLGGSHVRVGMIFGAKHLKLLVRVQRARVGAAAAVSGPAPNIYAVDLAREYTRREVEEAVLAIAIQAEEKRRQRIAERRREARLAGEYGEEAEGGDLEEHHFHDNMLDHPHGQRAGLHNHVERDGDPCWVEFRHHTHTRREDEQQEEKPVHRGRTRTRIQDDLLGNKGGGHAAVVVEPSTDGMYDELLAIIEDLRARLLRRESECERKDDIIARKDEEIQRLRARTDPSVARAADIIEQHRRGEL